MPEARSRKHEGVYFVVVDGVLSDSGLSPLYKADHDRYHDTVNGRNLKTTFEILQRFDLGIPM